MTRIRVSWHKASVSGRFCGFREVTKFAKVTFFLLAIDTPGKVDQRRKMQLQV
jgi:hypothetical protein